MLSTLLTWLTNGGISAIGNKILQYQELKFRAENNEQAREHEETIRRLEAQQQILMQEQKSKLTAWIRPALAFPVVIYWGKLILWDTIFKMGTTPYPGDHVVWYVTLIPAAYFLVRPFERR
jgi:hypothetical protein